VFASVPDQIIIVRMTASKPAQLNFAAFLDRPSEKEISIEGNDKLVLSGITGDCDSVKGK